MQNDDTLLTNVARNVQLERSALGKSVTQLAAEAGMSASYLYALEKGETNPGLAELERLAESLGRSVLQLLSTPTLEVCDQCKGCGFVRKSE